MTVVSNGDFEVRTGTRVRNGTIRLENSLKRKCGRWRNRDELGQLRLGL